jgi:hypothetical protein
METMTNLEFVAAVNAGRRDFSRVDVTGTVKSSQLPATDEVITVANIEKLECDIPLPCSLGMMGR